ncbi:MAG: hypothetical protein IJO31_02455 [Oscillospiraceae bacterium]|nr:hypothetical protein [Oscillospiraceae bacterium]
MYKRGQFTFYRSFYHSAQCLPPKQRLILLETIIRYALDGEEPPELKGTLNAMFLMIKPNLDTARKKAEAGALGGSKPKACPNDPYAGLPGNPTQW